MTSRSAWTAQVRMSPQPPFARASKTFAWRKLSVESSALPVKYLKSIGAMQMRFLRRMEPMLAGLSRSPYVFQLISSPLPAPAARPS